MVPTLGSRTRTTHSAPTTHCPTWAQDSTCGCKLWLLEWRPRSRNRHRACRARCLVKLALIAHGPKDRTCAWAARVLLGHDTLAIQADNEPAMRSLQGEVQRRRDKPAAIHRLVNVRRMELLSARTRRCHNIFESCGNVSELLRPLDIRSWYGRLNTRHNWCSHFSEALIGTLLSRGPDACPTRGTLPSSRRRWATGLGKLATPKTWARGCEGIFLGGNQSWETITEMCAAV